MEPNATLQQDRLGGLFIWSGKVEPVQVGRNMFKDEEGADADLYVQSDMGVDHILNNLSEEDREDVKAGWSVYCWIPDEYV